MSRTNRSSVAIQHGSRHGSTRWTGDCEEQLGNFMRLFTPEPLHKTVNLGKKPVVFRKTSDLHNGRTA